jgi:hypothetical protein
MKTNIVLSCMLTAAAYGADQVQARENLGTTIAAVRTTIECTHPFIEPRTHEGVEPGTTIRTPTTEHLVIRVIPSGCPFIGDQIYFVPRSNM